jgi:hypothetical protein
MPHKLLFGINRSFPRVFPTERQVTYVLLTRSPLELEQAPILVRLACIRHAASVHPEPGSNSLKDYYFPSSLFWICLFKKIDVSFACASV